MIQLPDSSLHIVLYHPEIPANTGNIGRLCVGSGSTLHLIKPCRFLLTDKEIKRAGLDYWPKLKLQMHDSLKELHARFPQSRFFYCSTKGTTSYTDVSYRKGDMFVFGPESSGLPQALLDEHAQSCITIPMHPDIRSLNLSNSVAIILYEALRQLKLS